MVFSDASAGQQMASECGAAQGGRNSPEQGGGRDVEVSAQGVRGGFHGAGSMVWVIFAVFSSMADTEQYFSFESFTASRMAFCDTGPRTR